MQLLVLLACLMVGVSADDIVIQVQQEVNGGGGCNAPSNSDDSGPDDDGSDDSGSVATTTEPPTCVGEGYVLHNDVCYYHSEDLHDFQSVQDECQALGGDWNFFYPSDVSEESSVPSAVLNGIQRNHWLGLRHTDLLGWMLYDSSIVPYTPSLSPGSGEECAYYGEPDLDQCSNSHGYICKQESLVIISE